MGCSQQTPLCLPIQDRRALSVNTWRLLETDIVLETQTDTFRLCPCQRVPLEPQTCLHDLVVQNPAVWQKSRRLSCVDTDPALSLPLEHLCDNKALNRTA